MQLSNPVCTPRREKVLDVTSEVLGHFWKMRMECCPRARTFLKTGYLRDAPD